MLSKDKEIEEYSKDALELNTRIDNDEQESIKVQQQIESLKRDHKSALDQMRDYQEKCRNLYRENKEVKKEMGEMNQKFEIERKLTIQKTIAPKSNLMSEISELGGGIESDSEEEVLVEEGENEGGMGAETLGGLGEDFNEDGFQQWQEEGEDDGENNEFMAGDDEFEIDGEVNDGFDLPIRR